jgi:hypothetical protein
MSGVTILGVRKHLALAGAALVVLAGCGRDERASEDVVYKVSVTVEKVPASLRREAPAFEHFEQVEWLWPSRDALRVERDGPVEPGSSEMQRTRTVCTGSACVRHASYDDRPSVRIGSPKFIRQWREDSFAFEALQRHVSERGIIGSGAQLTASRHGVQFRILVEERIPAGEAKRQKLFEIPDGAEVNLARELEVGEPSTLVKAYWFGPTLEHREATAATVNRHWSHPPGLARPGQPLVTETLHITFYVPPTERAKSNAIPGREEYAQDEVQVVSQPVDEPLVQRTLRVYDGLKLTGATFPRLRRLKIRLANGEEATLFFKKNEDSKGFSVLTEATLISAHGPRFRPDDAVALAQNLRPL